MKSIVRPSAVKHRFLQLLHEQTQSQYTLQEIWADWVRLASNSFIAACSMGEAKAKAEANYLKIVKRYERSTVNAFCEMLAVLVRALELGGPQDFLGEVYMSLELGSKHHAQFFTPYSLCKLNAQMVLEGFDPTQDLIKAHEPACGSGGMIIALFDRLLELGEDRPERNPQTNLYVEAWDLNETTARMAYLQFSLLGIPATVVCGNSLSLEVYATWHTIGYFRIYQKLVADRRQSSSTLPLFPTPTQAAQLEPAPTPQPAAQPVAAPKQAGKAKVRSQQQLTLF